MQENLGSGALLYQQIAAMIEDDILRGALAEEEQAPSTNELARMYRINPATAAKGINLLAARGILYKRRGIGMFVAAGAAAAVRRQRAAELGERYIAPLLRQAASLGLDKTALLKLLNDAIEKQEEEKP